MEIHEKRGDNEFKAKGLWATLAVREWRKSLSPERKDEPKVGFTRNEDS